MERQYKDSGVAWAEQIPSDWKVIRGKNLLKLMNRPIRETDDVVTCFRDGEVILRSERRTEGFTMSDKEIGYQGINKGDIVIHGMDGFAGSMGVSKSTGKGSPVLVVCNPKENDDSRYIIYYLRALAINNVFVALATGIRERSCDLRWNKISELPFIRPKADEQKRIADFIDAKIGEIEGLIALQEQMIAQLTDYKQSVITEAVTKGLNPNAQLVPSGIDWVGDIPKGWQVSKLKNFAKFINGDRGKYYPSGEDLVSNGVYFLTSNNIHEIILDTNPEVSKFITEERYNLLGGAKLELNDIVYCLRGSIGNCSINKTLQKGTVASSLMVIRVFQVLPEYVNYYLKSQIVAYQTSIYMNGSCAANLSAENVSNYRFICPNISEQRAIAYYLDTKCGEIDSLIATKRQKIEMLKEYKKSVIYEAVTGKTVIK